MRSAARIDAGRSSRQPPNGDAPFLSPDEAVGFSPGAFPGFKTQELLEIFLTNLETGLVVCDAVGRVTLVNKAARQLAQKDPEGELLSTTSNIWGKILDVNGRNIPAAEWPWVRALHGMTVLGSEYRLVQGPGDYRDVLFSAHPIQSRQSQRAGLLISLTDITEYKKKYCLLREHAVLSERTRLAGEIHDTVLQGLHAVVLQLEAAEKEFSQNSERGRERLRRLRDLTRQNLVEARRSIWALSSESFGNEDPGVALECLARRLFEGTPVTLHLHTKKPHRPMAAEVRFEILRIGKEALNNVLRHAGATLVRIELTYSHGWVRLSVLDNGRGFEVDPVSSDLKGYGLFDSRIRAERIGGRLMIHTAPGKGTRVVAIIPPPGT
jgi:signal transduction histidine kinase